MYSPTVYIQFAEWQHVHYLGKLVNNFFTVRWTVPYVRLVKCIHKVQALHKPAQAWRYVHHWWVWVLCCHPWLSSWTRSTECRREHQTVATSEKGSHLHRSVSWQRKEHHLSTHSYLGQTLHTAHQGRVPLGLLGSPEQGDRETKRYMLAVWCIYHRQIFHLQTSLGKRC